jgi:hypothetical protein
MNYTVEMCSGAMIYIPHREHGDRISLLSFFQNKESRLKVTNKSFKIVKKF